MEKKKSGSNAVSAGVKIFEIDLSQHKAIFEQKHSKPAFAVCIKNEDYTVSLELRKLYEVLPDDDAASEGYLRIIDESGEDYLYPENWFAPIELPQAVEEALLAAA